MVGGNKTAKQQCEIHVAKIPRKRRFPSWGTGRALRYAASLILREMQIETTIK